MGTWAGKTITTHCLALFFSLAAVVHTADAGSVKGQIKVDGKFGEAPERSQGFVPRIANPIQPVKRFDPTPYFVVVLEREGESNEDGNPPAERVSYDLLGESFEVPLLPVVVGSQIEIRNRGPAKAKISAPDYPDVLDEVSLDPKQTVRLKVDAPHQTIVISSPGAPHPQGRIVGFPNRYFAAVDRRGRFTISNVPEGTWKARLWYRDGWVEGVEGTVAVTRRRGELTLQVSPKQIPQPGND